MATSSTDAFSNNNNSSTILGSGIPLFSKNFNHPVLSVSTGPSHFWPHGDIGSSSSTSPISEKNWEVDEEETIKRRIYELKRQFHNGRFLIFRHLPRDTTEEDIRSVLQDTLVHSVQINHLNCSARVLLVEPEVLETWAKSTERVLKNQTITITPSSTENLLCVALLPFEYTEEDFGALASSFGEVNYSFLMRSEHTGESKGYGFIEYVNKEVAMQAKTSLDGRELLDCVLACDWLNSSHVTFASLHSTTVYVDRLPNDYRNMGEFRKIFSKVANPPYCQIAMVQGAVQNWGLVEFTSADEAEETQTSLNGFRLQNCSIRVSYYIPGVRAINIYAKMMNEPAMKNRGALLPEPPTNQVFSQLKNLTEQNPAFAKSLQNIILTQIQTLQQKSLPTQPPINANFENPGVRMVRACPPPPHLQVHQIPNPIHLQHPFSPTPAVNHPAIVQPVMVSQPSETLNPVSLNSNAQAALIILLAAQLQHQQESQLVNGNSRNATNTSGNGYADCNGVGADGNLTNCSPNILSNPQILNLLQTLVSQGDPQLPPQESSNVHITIPALAPHLPPKVCGLKATEVLPGQICNNNTQSHNLSAGLKSNFRNGYFKNKSAKIHKGPLLPTPVPSAHRNFSRNEDSLVDIGRVEPVLSDILNGIEDSSQGELSSISSLLSSTKNLQHLLGMFNHESTSVPLYTKPPPSQPAPISQTFFPRAPLYQTSEPLMPVLLRAPEGINSERFLTPPPQYQYQFPPRPNIHGSNSVISWPEQHPQTAPSSALIPSAIIPQPTTPIQSHLYSSTVYLPTVGASVSAAPVMESPLTGFSSPSFNTPTTGKKRKSNQFLPSPEPSPENGYIGQHSQGIGGHYLDSYILKKIKRQ